MIDPTKKFYGSASSAPREITQYLRENVENIKSLHVWRTDDFAQTIIALIKGPRGLKPLHVGIDPKIGATCIWAIVETDNEQIKHKVRMYGTGHRLDKEACDGDYIGTVIHDDGLVFHFYMDVKTYKKLAERAK